MMVCLLRLACIFYRRRQAVRLSDDIQLSSPAPEQIQLHIPSAWLDANPLTAADLDDEAELLRKCLNIQLRVTSD